MVTVEVDARDTVIRPAREDDLSQLLDLHQRVFDRPLSADQRRWKLEHRWSAVANVWVAEIEGRIVSHFAGIPVRFLHHGREVLAMQSVDVLTDPHHRRRGLVTRTAAAAFESWKRAGVAFRFSLPNAYWNTRADTHGFLRVGELRWWVRWLDPLRALAAKLGLPLRSTRIPSSPPKGRRPEIVSVSGISDAAPLDELWSRTSDEGVIRDGAWYRWRYLEGPRPYTLLGAWTGSRLGGVAALRLEGRSGTIAEIHGVDADVARTLLACSCRELLAAGALRAALLIETGAALEEEALAAGFLPRPHGFLVRALDLGGGLPRAARFQGGDFDVV
jgi:predicted N-acetyltransferase YhbS